MKCFYLRVFLIATIFLWGYFCPAFAQTQSDETLAQTQSDKTNESSSDGSSYGLFSSSYDQESESDPLNNGTGLFSGPPPGTGGDPIGGATPIGAGFSFLLGLSFFYLLYIAMFNFIMKKKMNKSVITFFVLLAVSITQAFGQTTIPANAKKIYSQDFGGNGPNGTGTGQFPTNAATTFFTTDGIMTTLGFLASSNNPGNVGPQGTQGQYTLSKNTANVSPRAWWGNAVAAGNASPTNVINDHTSPTDVNSGYMMVINASSDLDVFFKYPINGICPNTNLYFSFWAANLLQNRISSQVDPIFAAEIQDPEGNVLAILDSITPPMIATATGLSAANNYGWNNYVLSFKNTNYSTVYFVLINECDATNGNDLALDDIAIYKLSPDIPVASPSSPSFYYCEGLPMDMEGSYVDSTDIFEGQAQFAWLYSTDNFVSDSTLVSSDSICTEPAKEGWYKVIVGAQGNIDITDSAKVTYGPCCSASPSIQVHYIPPSTVLYWKPGAVNQDWNDFRNWQFVDGTPSPYAPNSCTDVHISGNASVYPSLDNKTTKNFFVCNNIWFHFGGLIGQPQMLKYDSAYVQYNFGGGNDPYSAPAMLRDTRWYALAAPLQRMATGDFGFCGYPTVWQQRFETTDQPFGEYGTLGPGAYAWYSPENTNAWDLGNQNNAIVIWAEVSPDPTMGLDGLGGILEVPYYKNPVDSAYHRGFYQNGNISYFQYYWTDVSGFPFEEPGDMNYQAPGFIDRGGNGEAFRFIYEGPPFSGSDGIYSMNIPSGMVMIGNPFMSDLDFTQFANDNGNSFSGYYLYSGSNFEAYSPGAGYPDPSYQYIAPLQAFFIDPSASTLTFNAKNEAVAASPSTNIPPLRSSNANSGGKADVMFMTASSKSGSSRVTLSMQNVSDKSLPLLLMKDYSDVPNIYAIDAAGQRNSIQFEGGYVDTIPLGVFSSNSADSITLTVNNKDKLSVNYLKLLDKYLNKTIDLLTTDTYTYANVPSAPDRFLLMLDYKTVTGVSSAKVDRPVNVSVSNNTLYVSSGVEIEDVSVITLQGITVVKDSNTGKLSYTKSLELPAGLYLVSVKLKTGQTSVAKVVVK